MRSGLSDPDDFTQAGQYYRSLSTLQQNHLVDNLASDLAPVSFKIQRIVLEHLHNASAELGERVTKQILVYAKR
ncbi:catalase-related domain-containing protein [Clostridium botulinum]|nr:catalase-related domain-containing protein [Clostridium botulinum]